jgi:tRNA-binding EMAP/Myf-like protein
MRCMSYGMICCAKPRLTEALYIVHIHILELHVRTIIIGIHKEPDFSQLADYVECQRVKL